MSVIQHVCIQFLVKLFFVFTLLATRRAGKSGYNTGDSLPILAALCERADEQLFRALKHRPTSSNVIPWANCIIQRDTMQICSMHWLLR